MNELKLDIELLDEPLELDLTVSGVEVIPADLANINSALDALNGASIAGQALEKIDYIDVNVKQKIKASIEDYDIIVGNDTFDQYFVYVDMIGSVLGGNIKDQLDTIIGCEVEGTVTDSITLISTIKSDLKTAIESKGSIIPAEATFNEFAGYVLAIEQIDILPINTALDELNGEVVGEDNTLVKIAWAKTAVDDMISALISLGVEIN